MFDAKEFLVTLKLLISEFDGGVVNLYIPKEWQELRTILGLPTYPIDYPWISVYCNVVEGKTVKPLLEREFRVDVHDLSAFETLKDSP